MKRSALAILVGLNVLLLGAIAWVWVTPSGTLRNMHWQSPEPVKLDLLSMLPALPGPGQADTSQFLRMLDRPLFSATRRPPPPPPAPAGQQRATRCRPSTHPAAEPRPTRPRS